MEQRICGKHDLKLPVLGLGCWAFGGGDYWGPVSQSAVNDVVRCAVDHGCNFFDTAEMYNKGASESSLGTALKGMPREKILIGSKISPSNTESKKLVEHCEASLRRLQTDYIDLYMVHWPITAHSIVHFTTESMPTPPVTEAFATLKELRAQGKIRHIGVSNFGVEKLDEAMATGAEIVANELPYSLLMRAIELEILPHCVKRGVGVMGYMALMQGILGKHYASVDEIPMMNRRTRHFDCRRNSHCRHGLSGAEAETMVALAAIRRIAQEQGMTAAKISLKWAIAGNGITTSLCGSCNVRNLEQNIAAALEPLPSDAIAALNRATQPLMGKLGPSFDYWEHPTNDRTRDLPRIPGKPAKGQITHPESLKSGQ
ncbi:MAG: aldo/keto reductase [Limisphaerales bacterium]